MGKLKNKIFRIAVALTLLWAGLLFAQTTLAQNDTFGLATIDQNVNLAGGDIRVTAAKIISAALGLLGLVTVALVLYGGYLYMTAAGNEEQVGKAKKIIINATIGLAIILSAFAITQFVLSSLNKAINGDGMSLGGDDGGGGGNCQAGVCDPNSDNFDEAICKAQCPTYSEFKKLAFYVESITPSTLSGDATGMNDITMRVLFSHSIDPKTDLLKTLTLVKEGDATALPITVALVDNGRVLEASYKNDGKTVPPTLDKKYSLTVDSTIKDVKGKSLDPVKAVTFPLTASFIVDKEFVDAVDPFIQKVTINNNGGNVIVAKGQSYAIGAKVNDRVSVNYGGVGLVRLTISGPDAKVLVDDYVAPTVMVGSSAEFTVAYSGMIDSRYIVGQSYTLTLNAFDIDHRNVTASLPFKIVAGHCDDKILNGDETSIDAGGSCGGGAGDACVENEDCASGFQCVDKICTAAPLIESVDPMNGASGNWITVLGKHFGSSVGKIEFATDFNKNGKYDLSEWVPAEVVSCDSGKPNWNSDWVVAQVPGGVGTLSDRAVKFNGVDGHVEIKGDNFELGKNFTFEAWVKPAKNNSKSQVIIAKRDGSKDLGYYLSLDESLRPTIYLPGLSNPGPYHASVSLSPDIWSHLTVESIFDGVQIRWFVNGKFINMVKDLSGSVTATSGKNLWIGMREDLNKQDQFEGFMDEIAIYDRALSSSEVLDHYVSGNQTSNPAEYQSLILQDGPVGYWRLGDDTGSVASDSSSHQYNGTYVGGFTLGQDGIFPQSEGKIGIGATSAIRLTVANGGSFDTTVDTFGPKPNGDGLFIKNDIKRPGLCRVGVTKETQVVLAGKEVTLPIDNPAALPEVPVTAHGSGFGILAGASKVTFGAKKDVTTGELAGGFQGEVKGENQWTDQAVNTKVPENIKPGALAVHVTAAGQTSNGVKFNVLSPDASQSAPQISTIDPASTTPKSYITIKGSGFGNQIGHVYLADTKDHVATCGTATPDESCEYLNVSAFPAVCGVTWTDTQVIAEIPDGTTIAKYHAAVKNTFNFQTGGAETVEIISGAPLPSICRLDPKKGPAPLPADNAGIIIYGTHFGNAPVVYYWQPNAKVDTYATWLNSLANTANGEAAGPSVIKNTSANQITTLLPVASSGSSLAPGANPIKVKTEAGMSNAVYYEVEKCTDAKKPLPGYHCCAKGPEKDVWKKNSQMCSGENREAGYVWRFSTGMIPYTPSVVEKCDGISFPSPTPRKINGVNDASCLNSSIAVRFTMGMTEASLNKDTVKVFACGSNDKGEIDCAKKKDPVTPLDLLYQTGANTLIIRQVPPQTALPANTWHQVELSDKIRSQQYSVVFNVGQYTSSTLAVTKPCGSGTAYCFTFKTGSQECSLAGAGINPPDYTTHQLGVIQDPKYAFDGSQFYLPPNLPPHPYYYFVWGKGNQECSVINVDGFPWQWSPYAGGPESTKATAFKTPSAPLYLNSRAAVSAESHTAPDKVIISAQAAIKQKIGVESVNWTNVLLHSGYYPGKELVGPLIASPSIPNGNLLDLSIPFSLEINYKIEDASIGTVTKALMSKVGSYALVYFSGFDAQKGLCIGKLNGPSNLVSPYVCTNEPAKNNQEYHYILAWNGSKMRWYGKNGTLLSEAFWPQLPNTFNIPLNFGKDYVGQPGVPLFKKRWFTLRVVQQQLSDFFLKKFLSSEDEVITATSNLVVDLYDPEVVEYEPNCIESCVNAAIRARFNRQMDPETYAAGFKVYRCPDGVECLKAVEILSTDKDYYQVDAVSDDGGSNYQILSASLGMNKTLTPNAYYKVSLNGTGSDIKSLNSLNPKKFGKALPKTEWVFKTRADGTPCSVGSIQVVPTPFTATSVGQKDKFIATPYSAPNACSKVGQALNKWDYQYAWSTLNAQVATVSQVGAANVGDISPFCTNYCVKKGSVIAKNSTKAGDPLCGNAKKENGEDCDIGIAGEKVGVSCTLNCLRPGNTAGATPKDFASNNLCGNGKIEYTVGEQCDPGHDVPGNVKKDDQNCTEQCLLRGSSQQATGKVGESVCNNNDIDPAEACDIKDEVSKAGCTQSCLHQGTPTAAWWCFDNKTLSQWNSEQCKQSVSVCGNGHLEPSEECEVGIDGVTAILCNDKCLFTNACPIGSAAVPNLCKPSGSSPKYAQASLCGDGIVGAGEDIGCEVKSAEKIGAGPAQVVEAKGLGEIAANTSYQQTKIKASIQTKVKLVEGTADYQLMCGYHEFTLPNTDGHYNDCANNTNAQGNHDNHLGVSAQSCCMPRPKWSSTYPSDGAGIDGSAAVCRNSLIKVEFSQEMRPDSLSNNIFLVRAHGEANFKCVAGTLDVTGVVTSTLQFSQANAPLGFWASLWESIKNFFAYITGGLVNASSVKNSADVVGKVWCANEVPVNLTTKTQITNNATTTIATLGIQALLEKNAVYGVLMRGEVGGIVDWQGVPLGAHDGFGRNDIWFFKTNDQTCKIKSVQVEPQSHLYTAPNASFTFSATAVTDKGQLVTSIPSVYAWQWSWQPQLNPVFAIPSAGTPGDQDTISIASKNVEGHIAGIASAKVTVDTTGENVQLGQSFTGNFDLNALFCAQPWPGVSKYPFKDTKYNMSFSYCSDAGKAGNLADDLPYLSEEPLEFISSNTPAEKKCSLSKVACTISKDCDLTLFNIPVLGNVNVPTGKGICFTNNNTAPVLNGSSVLTCTEAVQCYVNSINQPTEIVYDMAVSGKEAYLAVKGGLKIYDFSNAAQPLLLGSLTTTGLDQYRVVVAKPYAYLSSPDGGLQIIDIANPALPKLVKAFKAGFTTFDVAVNGNRAYAALSNKRISAIDMSNPNDPKITATLTLTEDIKKLSVSQSRLIAGGNGSTGYVVDLSKPDELNLLGKFQVQDVITDVLATPDALYVSGGDVEAGVFVVDPNLAGSPVEVEGVTAAKSLMFFEGKLYASEFSGKIKEITLASDKPPVVTQTYTVPTVSSISKIASGNGNWYLLALNASGQKVVLSFNKAVYDTKTVSCTTEFPGEWKNICATDQVTSILNKDTLKKQLFFNNKNDDAIGLQIFSLKKDGDDAGFVDTNLEKWYTTTKGFGTLGDMKVTTVAGYNALTDGNNYYILALNYDPASVEQVYANVYLLSINSDAQAETREVFNRILKNLNFNINLTDHGRCLSTTGNVRTKPDDTAAAPETTCATDFDCRDSFGSAKPGTNGTCSNAKTKFSRDWRRLHDIQSAQDYLDAYFESNTAIDFKGSFSGGSFVPGYTVSRWGQSWGVLQQLGGAAGAGSIQSDPLNQWTDCGSGGADKQTCWDASQTTYYCPKFASVYEYEYVSATKDYIFHAPLEFFTTADYITKQFVDAAKFSPERWSGCATGSYNPFNQKCGDGVLGPGEACEPPGAIVASAGSCPNGQVATNTCSNTCAWTVSACQEVGKCGNGIVESAEVCDDGALNNTYGHCKGGTFAEGGCQGLFAAYCGNGTVDFDDKNNNNKPDAGEKKYEFCEAGVNGYQANYNLDKTKSCSWDCQGVGGYCGDKIIQSGSGEECDEGSSNGKGVCLAGCKLKKFCDYSSSHATQSCSADADCPVTLLAGGIQVPMSGTTSVCVNTTTNAPDLIGANVIPCVAGKCTFAASVCKPLSDVATFVESKTVSCKSPASFCGDGKIGGAEQCDDGNVVAGDGCSDVCSTETKAPSCGNGKIEPELGEKCDLGAKNGIACDPGYGAGKECVYCSGNCKDTLTVSAATYCGDGIIQKAFEACDVIQSGTTPGGIPVALKEKSDCGPAKVACDIGCGLNGSACKELCLDNYFACLDEPITKLCPDKGSYQCTNSCTLLASQCVSCGLKDNGTGAKISVINPLVQSYADSPLIGTTVYTAYLYDKKSSYQNISWLPFQFLGGSFDLLQPTPFMTTDQNGTSAFAKIEANLLCTDNYSVVFNIDKIKLNNPASKDFNQEADLAGSVFSYSVNGEVASVSRDIIMSPAVPPGFFRVVIKWTSADKDTVINSYVFNEKYSTAVQVDGQFQDAVDHNERYQTGACPSMIEQTIGGASYWMGAPKSINKCSSGGGVQVHPNIHTQNTYVQSFTVNTANYTEPFAFFISGLDKPIGQYKNSSLEVQVYEYHAGQKPLYSIYEPTQVFTLTEAFKENTNYNSNAQYWHAFNLVKQNGSYVAKPVVNTNAAGAKVGEYKNGSIETDFSQVLKNLASANL